jgi:hypothetical protein
LGDRNVNTAEEFNRELLIGSSNKHKNDIPKISFYEAIDKFKDKFTDIRKKVAYMKLQYSDRRAIIDSYEEYVQENDPNNFHHSSFINELCFSYLFCSDTKYPKLMKDLEDEKKCSDPFCTNRARQQGCSYCKKMFNLDIKACDDHLAHDIMNNARHLNWFRGI